MPILPEATSLVSLLLLAISVTAGLAVKDVLFNVVQGLLFFIDPSFMPGDKVIVDGEDAIIIRIGLTTTVFQSRGDNGSTRWRYVRNERIKFLKLEKVVEQSKSE